MASRTIIITGSTRGIGEGAALHFARAGDRLVLFCRHLEHALAARQRLSKICPEKNILATHGDVRQVKDVKRVVEETLKAFGRIDTLVNNAGVAYWKPLQETSEQEWDTVLDTNLKGYFLFIKEVLPVMQRQKGGVIINVSSGLGVKGGKYYSAYSSSKFGIIGLSQCVAQELAGSIKVYSILPGGVATRLHLDIHPWEKGEEMMTPEYVGLKIFEAAAPGFKLKSGSSIEVYK